MRTITIGRAPSCHIIINDPNVSRIHAEISVENGQYVYRDMSSNGTMLNGRRINNERVFVMPYSNIILANSVPLPWNKVLPILPLPSGNSERKTVPLQRSPEPVYQNVQYNVPQPPHVAGNNSGMGSASIVPPEIYRWNWGAFFLSWIWGIGNKSYLTLLCLIPYFNFIWIFVAGAYGSKWAWQNNKWDSIEHFQRVQQTWAKWGIGLFVGSIALMVALIIISVALSG